MATGRGIREHVDTPASRAEPSPASRRGSYGGRPLPHLWTVNDELVVTVAGDLVRTELLAIGQSLRRTPGP